MLTGGDTARTGKVDLRQIAEAARFSTLHRNLIPGDYTNASLDVCGFGFERLPWTGVATAVYTRRDRRAVE
jgi:hypothetical protein